MSWYTFVKILRGILLTIKVLIIIVLLCALLGVSFLAGFFTEVIREMPLIEKLNVPNPAVTSRIYDASGKFCLGSLFSEENRILINFNQIPDDLKNAVIAIEDRGFYQHPGISPRGIVRALVTNLKGGRISQGASTITQQLVRNLYLSKEKTWRRKILEMIIALKLEQRFSKDEILTFYLNEVFFGRNSYGVEAAAQFYFEKHVSDLNLSECALLAGLPQRPSDYAPSPDNQEAALGRRNVVLHAMLDCGFISDEESERARNEPIVVKPARETSYKGLYHPYYTTYVIKEVKEILGDRVLLFNGLNIYTTINLDMQEAAERILAEKVAEYANLDMTQGALITIDPKTGAILAMVGGVDFNESEFNRAWQAKRQPGSAFKPFVYLRALEKGYSPSSLIVDEQVVYKLTGQKDYKPNNYDHTYLGVITAKTALARSRNVCAVKTIDIIGPGEVTRLCTERLGFKGPLHPYLSLALGASEVTAEEMCAAFATFANDGVYNKPFTVLRITDVNGNILYEHNTKPTRAVKENDVRLLNVMTQAVVQAGTATRARIKGRKIAGKTGTTSEYSDAWFIGYTPNLCTAVWVGNDDQGDYMRRVTGGRYPAVIWHDYMVEALEGYPVEDFPSPKYPSRVKPLDKERTNSELREMLEWQEFEKSMEEGEEGDEEPRVPREFRHPWEPGPPDDDEDDWDDEWDDNEIYF